MKIALIEDDDVLSTLLCYNFQSCGLDVEHFANGQVALASIARRPPNLVVLDWSLPGLSGIEILRRLRAGRGTGHIPVFMVTARCDPLDRARALATGADAYFAKPFSIAELLQGVLSRLDAHKLRQPCATVC